MNKKVCIFKSKETLATGDLLVRKESKEECIFKEVYETETSIYYVFNGFHVNGRLMFKFFENKDGQLKVINYEKGEAQ